MLHLDRVCTFYDNIQALFDVSINVNPGEVVTLIGANGAGKTTTLRTISGLLRPAAGSVEFAGEKLNRLSPEAIVTMGIVHVPEGRRIFPGLTVLENLKVVGYALGTTDKQIKEDVDRVLQTFPALKQRINKFGWSLSGGEQQMVAIGRGLMARPKVLLLDEPSLGLAPIIVEEVFGVIKELNKEGVTILLVEQNAFMALHVADRGYVLENGRIVLEDTAKALLDNAEVKNAYLGGTKVKAS